MKSMGECEHPKCSNPAATGLFACNNHWFVLDRSFRTAIQRAYARRDPERREQELARLTVRAQEAWR